MKIKIAGNGRDGIFPLNYRVMIISLIKKAIETGDEELYKKLYFYEDKKSKKIKPFTFAVYFKDFKVEKSIVNVNGEVSIIISTPDYNLGIAIYNGLLNIQEYQFNNEFTFIKTKVMLEKESIINSSEVQLKTLSPIHVKDRNNKPVEINTPNFEEELNYISDVLLNCYRGYGLKERLIFIPINMKKVVVKEKLKGFINESNKEFIYINAYSGIFSMKGNIEDLQLLMQLGIGFRRSEGFGLIDLL